MEQCFRTALWMLLLIGYLQAAPTSSKTANRSCRLDRGTLGLSLIKDVSCKNNVSFTSPNLQGECFIEALKLFIEEMDKALKNCEKEYVGSTKEALELAYSCSTTNKEVNARSNIQCNFTKTVHENFGQFVNATETFAQQWNSSH